MATGTIEIADIPLVHYALRRADDALVLGHRLSEWCGHAPTMEEEMALANMGLDLIGQSRSLYTYAGEAEGVGHGEDDFAYLRRESGYQNLLLVEQDNGDFAMTMLRQLLYAAFAFPWWRAMRTSKDATLAAIAAKAEKEMAYHLRHSAEWVVRLGDSTPEARKRIEAAISKLWPYTGELFAVDAIDRDMIDRGVVSTPRRCGANGATPWRPCSSGRRWPRPRMDGCSRGGGRARIPRPSAACCASCNICSAPCRERPGERGPDNGNQPHCRIGLRPGNSRALHRRSRRAA